jgi:Uma2 family endonuclease
LTAEEYLAQERLASFKSEFYQGEVFAMAGARFEHNRVKENLARQLGNALEGSTCFPLSSDMRIHMPSTTLYTYPDIVIVCGEPAFTDEHRDVLLNPKVIVEVLSDSTEKYDRGAKFQQYQHIDSLREYILVSQNEARIECYVRQNQSKWLLSNYVGLSEQLVVSSVDVSTPLQAIYEGVLLESDVSD